MDSNKLEMTFVNNRVSEKEKITRSLFHASVNEGNKIFMPSSSLID
jgi:hypothetical protein